MPRRYSQLEWESDAHTSSASSRWNEDELAVLQAVFCEIDQDNDGTINSGEVHTLIAADSHEPDMEAINLMMIEFDDDGDGKISFHEFIKMIECFENRSIQLAQNETENKQKSAEMRIKMFSDLHTVLLEGPKSTLNQASGLFTQASKAVSRALLSAKARRAFERGMLAKQRVLQHVMIQDAVLLRTMYCETTCYVTICC